MKISIFVSMFPPKRLGGTEIATLNIAKHLTRNHEVHIITTLDEGLPKESWYKGILVHRIPWPKIRILGGFLFWFKAYRILRKIKPDIIHVQNIELGKYVYHINKFLRKPYIIWARGSDVNFLAEEKIERTLKMTLKKANAVISLTEDMKYKIRKFCDREIFVIPNGIELDLFRKLSKKDLREKFGLNKNEKVILYVGTLRPVKGLSFLINAMKTINEKNIRLLLIGRGEEKEQLEKQVKKLKIENIVTFIGRIPNEEVFKYMAASDVLVLPSLSEGFPNVILEAMASGLPVVATNVGGLPEVINENINGFLVEPKNPKQISEKISLLFKDERLRKKIIKNNLEDVKNYSWESVIEKLEKIYFEVTNKNLKNKI